MVEESKKLALVRIWEILKKESDSEHLLTQSDIANKLNDTYGIEIERKAIGRNIDLLRETGLNIVSKREGCYLATREFEDEELRLLIENILSVKNISAEASKNLINKICNLSNKYFRTDNQPLISTLKDWNKTDNDEFLNNIEIIKDAISKNRQISYNFNKYGENKKLNAGNDYVATPYAKILHNQKYYLIAYIEDWHRITFTRIDHMKNMKILEDKFATPLNKVPNLNKVPGFEKGIIDYKVLSSLPYMFSDELEPVTLIVKKKAIDSVIEWFGADNIVYIRQNVNADNTVDDNTVEDKTVEDKTVDDKTVDDKTVADKTFRMRLRSGKNTMKYWALQYIESVEVISPKALREEIKKSLESGIEKYSKKI